MSRSSKLILSKIQKSTLDILYSKSTSSNNTSNDNTEDESSQDSNYNFQPFSTSGHNIASRYHHKTITFDNHLFVFGGCDKINPKKAKIFYHTIDKLDLTTKKWSSLTKTEVKSNDGERKTNNKDLLEFPRVIFHSAVLIDYVVYIFGGIDEYFQPQRDVLTLDLQNNKISSLPGSMLLSSFIAQNVFDVQYENQPSALFFSSSFVKTDKKRIIEEAENDNNSEDKLIKDEEKPTFDTLNLYFPKKQQFQHISIEDGISPPLLHFYSSVHSNNQIYIFGGSNTHFIWSGKKKVTNELYIFDIPSMKFSNPKTTGTPPSPRMGHTMAIIDEKLFVFGGTDEEGILKNDLYILYLLSFNWKKFSNFPSVPRTFHSSYSLLSLSVFSFYFIGGTKSAQIDQFSYNTSLPLLFSAEIPSSNNNNQSSGAQNGSSNDSSKSSDNSSSSPPNSSPSLDRSEKEEEEDEEKLKAKREEEKRMEEENKVLIEYISHLNEQTNYVIKELLQITTISNNPKLINDQLHDRSLKLSRFTSQLLDPFEYHKFVAIKSQSKSPQFIDLSNNDNNNNVNNNNVFCKNTNGLKEIERLSSKTPPKDLFQTLRTLTLPEKQLSSSMLLDEKLTSTVMSPRSKASKSYSMLPDISSLTISRSRSRTSSNNLSSSNSSSIAQSSPKKIRSLQKSKSKGGKGTERKVNSPTVSEFLDVSLSCLKSLDIPTSKSSPLLFSTSSTTTSVNRSRSSRGYNSRSPSPRRISSSSSFQQLITPDSYVDASKKDPKEENEIKSDNKRDSKRESHKLLLDKSNEESREEKKRFQIDEKYLEYISILKRFARSEISFIKRLSMVVSYLVLPLSDEYRPWVSSQYSNAKKLFNLFQKIMDIFDFHSQFISQLLPLFDLLPLSFNDQNSNNNNNNDNTIEQSPKNVISEESKIEMIKGNMMKIIDEFSSKFERVKTVYSKFQSGYMKNNEYLLDFLDSKFDNLKQLILSSVQSHFYQFQFDNYYPFLIKRVRDYASLLKRITDLHSNNRSLSDLISISETVQQKYRDLFSSLSIG